MDKKLIIAFAALSLLLGTSVVWSQTTNASSVAAPDSLQIATQADSIRTVLPASTDPALARETRSPRNITSGYYIIIRKGMHKLLLYKDGSLINTFPVGTGKNPADKAKEGDMATPEGHYRLSNIYNSKDWIYTHPINKTKHKHVYGPWFLSVDTSSEGSFSGGNWVGIGIHGTNNDESIGGDVSSGCIRLFNKDITSLKELLDDVKDVTSIPVDILR